MSPADRAASQPPWDDKRGTVDDEFSPRPVLAASWRIAARLVAALPGATVLELPADEYQDDGLAARSAGAGTVDEQRTTATASVVRHCASERASDTPATLALRQEDSRARYAVTGPLRAVLGARRGAAAGGAG